MECMSLPRPLINNHSFSYEDSPEESRSPKSLSASHVRFILSFLADRTAAHSMIGYWHDTVVCPSVRPSVRLSVCLSVTLRTVAKRYVGLLQQKCLNKWIIGLTAHSSMILHRLTPYIDPFPSSSLPPKLSRFKSDQDDIWRIVLQVNVHELAESDFWWRHTFKMAAMTSWQLTFARCLSAEREWRHWVAISATVPDP